MTITAINTLEIRLFDGLAQSPEGDFEQTLNARVEALQSSSGCLGYVLGRSDKEASLWVLCGYWRSEAQMTQHFDSLPMTLLVNFLIEAGAHVNFASFLPAFQAVASDAV